MMTDGPRKMTIWCTTHRSNVTDEPIGVLRHAPGGDLCDGTEFFMTTERMIGRDTALAELTRYTLPGSGQVYEGAVRLSSTRDDFTEVETRVIPAGVLQVTGHYRAVKADDPSGPVTVGWECTRREALLNGELVIDPERAQALAEEAGIRSHGWPL